MTTLSLRRAPMPASASMTRPARTPVPGTTVSPYAAHLALLGEPDSAPQPEPIAAAPVVAAPVAMSIAAPATASITVATPTRRDVAMRDGVLGFVVGVVALSVVLVAAATFAATQA